MTDIKVGDTVRIKESAKGYASRRVGQEFIVQELRGGPGTGADRYAWDNGENSGGVYLKDLELVKSVDDSRWRYNDHIVVYPETRDANGPGRGVTVLDETPLPKIYTRWENQDDSLTRLDDEITSAARAYWEAHEPNPVIKEAKVRGDYAYFAYQLRYNDTDQWLANYTKADIDAALPVIDWLALNASGE